MRFIAAVDAALALMWFGIFLKDLRNDDTTAASIALAGAVIMTGLFTYRVLGR